MNGSSETMNGHHLNNGSAHCGAQNASSNGHSGVGGHPTKIVVLVAGAAGFIGSHMARRLKHDPAGRFTVVGADVRTNDYMQPDEFCDVFHQVDLRSTSLLFCVLYVCVVVPTVLCVVCVVCVVLNKQVRVRTFGTERENCLEVTKGCHWVFNFAADMGGMGYIQSNQAYILYNNTMITFNMAEASRLNGVQR
jgi:GDP-D-mannose 3',5'-epimerase